VTAYPRLFTPVRIGPREAPFVIDHEPAVAAPERLRHRVVVLDAVGHIEAIGRGELLAAAGRDVDVVTPLASPIHLHAEAIAMAPPRAIWDGHLAGRAV
jgi:hypothetical protein